MFTGLIETVGQVAEVRRREGGLTLAVSSTLPISEISLGESIAVDGVCLSVVARDDDRFEADVIPETLSCTTLSAIEAGVRVNLERSLRLGDRLGGHLVQGHVDAVASVLAIHSSGDDHRVRVNRPAAIGKYVAQKGSVALHGVSLTVAALAADWFEVALVPHTLAHTNLGELQAGGSVNVEVDLVARYLEELTRSRPPGAPGQDPTGGMLR